MDNCFADESNVSQIAQITQIYLLRCVCRLLLDNQPKQMFHKKLERITTMTKVKKELLKFGIQTVINLLAAVLTALGATSCM